MPQLSATPPVRYLFVAIIGSNVQWGEKNRVLNVHVSPVLQKNIDSLEGSQQKIPVRSTMCGQLVKQDFETLKHPFKTRHKAPKQQVVKVKSCVPRVKTINWQYFNRTLHVTDAL